VHPKANVGEDVVIGPYCVVGEHVTIGDQTELLPHVCIEGHTEIGRCCRISPFASIGTPPQHLQYKDEPTKVSIGDHNIIRENVTINRGTAFGSGITRIGDHNFLMAYTHVAHDCELGNHIIMANAANLAGHVSVGNSVVIGGLVGVHQYVRIGEYAMVGCHGWRLFGVGPRCASVCSCGRRLSRADVRAQYDCVAAPWIFGGTNGDSEGRL
jgi:UDP-N-acetylglucosamine acyltransferase